MGGQSLRFNHPQRLLPRQYLCDPGARFVQRFTSTTAAKKNSAKLIPNQVLSAVSIGA
jgi:hypothetical protein